MSPITPTYVEPRSPAAPPAGPRPGAKLAHQPAPSDVTEVAHVRITEPRHRLHPVTPVLRGIQMLLIAIAIFSWQGYERLGPVRWAIGALLVLLVAVALATVSWFVTGYQIIGRELRISEGLLWRRTRAIPLERLQTVDVVRSLLARITGVAELRLEVVGASRAEAPLAYLSQPVAARLRDHLLSLSGARPYLSAGEARRADRLVHAVSNWKVLFGQILTPQALLFPFMVAFALLPYVQQLHVQQLRWNFVAMGSLLTAIIGVIQVPVRRLLAEWHFRIYEDPAGLRLRHGLLSTRSQTVPAPRVQAIGLTWPLMWRPLRWSHAHIDVAGYGAHDPRAGLQTGVLLPVAGPDTTQRVVAEVLGTDIWSLELVPVPERARWLAPLRYKVLAFGFDGAVAYSRDGWVTRELTVAPLARSQSIRVTQSPIQRWLRLASLHVDSAGRLHVVGQHRDVEEAYALAETLASAAAAARARELGAHHRSDRDTTPNANPT